MRSVLETTVLECSKAQRKYVRAPSSPTRGCPSPAWNPEPTAHSLCRSPHQTAGKKALLWASWERSDQILHINTAARKYPRESSTLDTRFPLRQNFSAVYTTAGVMTPLTKFFWRLDCSPDHPARSTAQKAPTLPIPLSEKLFFQEANTASPRILCVTRNFTFCVSKWPGSASAIYNN